MHTRIREYGAGRGHEGVCTASARLLNTIFRLGPVRSILTYFHPKHVLQQEQWMSATVWSPVMRTRSSLGPRHTFTLRNAAWAQASVQDTSHCCLSEGAGAALCAYTLWKR